MRLALAVMELVMATRGSVLIAACVALAFLYTAYEAQTGWSQRSRLFGYVLLAPALVLAAVQLVREIRAWRAGAPVAVPKEAAFSRGALAWFATFFASAWLLGMLVTVPLYSLGYLRLAGREPWWRAALYALIALAFVYVLFVNLLHVPLPKGVIGDLTGIP